MHIGDTNIRIYHLLINQVRTLFNHLACAFQVIIYLLFAGFLLSKSYAQELNKSSLTPHQPIVLKVGILYNTKGQRGFYRDLAKAFEKQHPNIKVLFTGRLDAEYKKVVPLWLHGKDGVDIIQWQAGERLLHFARQDLLHPIDKVWEAQSFDAAFPNTITELISLNGHKYGIPFSYYTWGMFYNVKVLKQLKISPPTTWASLLNMCKLAHRQGITPIMLASKDPWVPLAWFDYLNLRLNGLAFHQSLMAGQASFLDDRVRRVFEHWLVLINENCFNSDFQTLTWRGLFPPIYRKLAVSTLMASFIDRDIPLHLSREVQFKSFPIIDENLPLYEDTPVDVFTVLARSQQKRAAEKLIAYLGEPRIQSMISAQIGQSAPHRLAEPSNGIFSKQNTNILKSSAGLAQFFDRDIKQSMVSQSSRIINEFMIQPDINSTMNALEKVRIQALHQLP